MIDASAARLSLASFCGEAYRRKYVDPEPEFKERVSYSMIVGTAVHEATTASLRARINGGAMHPDTAATIAGAAFDQGIRDAHRSGHGLERARSQGLARNHATHWAPFLSPIAVEQGFSVEPKGYGVRVRGYIDLVELRRAGDLEGDPGGASVEIVVDHKTVSKTPPRGQAATSLALKVYSLARLAKTGKMPDCGRLDFLKFGMGAPSTSPDWPYSQTCQFTPEDIRMVLARLESLVRVHETGAFVPASTDLRMGGWKCSRQYCEFWDTCRYAGAPVSINIPMKLPILKWQAWNRGLELEELQ